MAKGRKRARKRNLEHLADALIARHLRISVPDGVVRDQLAAAKSRGSYPTEMVARKFRCIAIVGAGASAPLRERANELASMLEDRYGRDEAELERLTLVSNLKRKDFETRLTALSRTPDAAREVRRTIAERYDIRHPPVLAYELLAHLLKHRFLDAIVTFNFDQLLDRSLDDELGTDEYKCVVSERDCDVQHDPHADNYVPLYIKLHGTASEPESLRFAPDSYYWLPPRILRLVRELMHTEECLIVNIGSGLGSFDFQRLLGIPDRLTIYNLSPTKVPKRVRRKIAEERRQPKLTPAPLTPESVIGKRDVDERWLYECSAGGYNCDNQMRGLARSLKRRAGKIGIHATPGSAEVEQLAPFRSTRRHETVVDLLGPESLKSPASAVEEWSKEAELEYLKKRIILELAYAGAKARGLLSLATLTVDRPARYYDLYRRKTNGRGEDWATFCSAAGLAEAVSIPDVLVSARSLRSRRNTPDISADLGSRALMKGKLHKFETHMLHEFDPKRLAHHVGYQIKNPISNTQLARLTRTLDELQQASDIEFHIQDDRVCAKAFTSPVILRTNTSMKVYTWLMLRNLRPEDHLYISSETGGWLLHDNMVEILKRQEQVRLLVAFDIERKKLRSRYKGTNLDIKIVNPWHHNRHMTIVCSGDQPRRAIYFARHLRSPIVTAVYLESIRDVQHLMRTFAIRWKEANRAKL